MPGGRNTPGPLRPLETMKVAFSRAESMRRLPPPAGLGWRSLPKDFRDDGGIMQPIAMPVLVEKWVTGMLDFNDEKDGEPWTTVWTGDSSKRQGRVDGSGASDDRREEYDEVCFQGCGR
ncbi:predicted protein [Histoplasma capsulatum var. duboisii H88]|uniref:Predicted protein n=1 Tax=Ajellomyces capsulatus (strain H88) TaxID=544711 RepID=F0U4G3_AJEC8|nr:predicted protein [Histoplasma capsulatum var. duboisii H88]